MTSYINVWQKSIAITACLSLSAIANPHLSNAAPESTLLQNRGEYQLVQTSNCRQVESDIGLNVRESPSVDGRVIMQLADEQRVNIVNSGSNGWVPIQAPVKGYVESNALTYCTGTVPAPNPATSTCRKIESYGGLNVRETPSIDSRVIGRLDNQQVVKIVNPGSNGWVPIQSPVRGYIASNYLTYCSLNQQQALQ